MKLLLKLIVLLVLVIVAAVVVLFYSIDRIARHGIERGATFAMGVPVTLESANVGIFAGTFRMGHLNVGNPAGFRTEHFLHLGEGAVAVTLPTLRQDVVELPQLRLEDISINLEKSAGKANFSVITENLKRFESKDPGAPDGESADAKRFIVRELAIRNVDVHVDLLPVGGELTRANLRIEQILLNDIGADNASGVVMGELASIIVRAILQAATDLGGGIIPSDILGELGSQLAQLGDLGAIRARLTEGLGEGISERVSDAVGDAAKAAEEAAEGVRRGLEGLRPR